MTVTALSGPFIGAAGFTKGRSRGPVKWLVVHTAEGSTDVLGLGHYFAGTIKGSSNCGIGQQGQYALYVSYVDTPWTNPSINTRSDTVELCAFKAWSRQQWLDHPKMLEALAHWLAWRAAVRGIPIRLISGAQAAAGMSGILDHRRVNDGFHASDHTDVGDNFPWDVVLPRALAISGAKPKPLPPIERVLGVQDPFMTGPDVVGVRRALRLCGNNITDQGPYDYKIASLIDIFKQHRGITGERGVGPKTKEALRRVPGVH